MRSNEMAHNEEEEEYTMRFSPEFDTFPIFLAVLIAASNSFVLFLTVKVRSLRTVTNFILRSLAISDLLSGVPGIPLYLGCNTVRTTILCGFTQVLTKFFSVSIVLHLFLVSIDRYVAVVHAMRYRSLVTKRKVVYLVLSAWAAAVFVAVIQLSWIGLADVDVNEDGEMKTKRINTIYDIFCIIMFWAVPLITMILCYSRVFIVLRKQLRSIAKNNIPASLKDLRTNARERRAAFTFIGMITVYVVCWLPYFMLNLQHDFGNDFFTLPILVEYVVFYYPKFLSSLLNPLLYVFFKHDFRKAAIKVFRGTERQRKQRSVSLSLQNTIGKWN